MREKILALLVASYSGVRKDGLAQLAGAMALHATTEEEAKTLVDKLTADQVGEFIKDFRKSVDKEISVSNETYKENLKKKFNLVDKGTPDTEPEPDTEDPSTEVPSWAKAIIDQNKALVDKLKTFEGQETSKTRLQTLTGKLTSCKDEAYKSRILKDFGRMKDMSDEEFTEYLTETETDISNVNQNVVNSALGNQNRPWMSTGGAGAKEASKEEIDAVFEKLPI